MSAYFKPSYTWAYEQIIKLSEAKALPIITRVNSNKNEVKEALDSIKKVMLKERDPERKRRLAEAGIALNLLLFK